MALSGEEVAPREGGGNSELRLGRRLPNSPAREMAGTAPSVEGIGRRSGADRDHADPPDFSKTRRHHLPKGHPLFENKVTDRVALMQGRIDGLDADALARVEAASTLEMDEWLQVGDMASRLMLAGLLDQNAAQSLHAIHTDFRDGATLAQRVTFLQIMGEYLDMQVKGVAI